MCAHPPDRKWHNGTQLRCRECHRLNVRHLRLMEAQGKPKIVRYRLNTDLFKSSVSRFMRSIILELSGINSDSAGQYYAGCALQDSYRRSLLSKESGIPEDQLWIKEVR